jgi:hypothetical protein
MKLRTTAQRVVRYRKFQTGSRQTGEGIVRTYVLCFKNPIPMMISPLKLRLMMHTSHSDQQQQKFRMVSYLPEGLETSYRHAVLEKWVIKRL